MLFVERGKAENMIRHISLGQIGCHFTVDSRREGTGAKSLIKMYVRPTGTYCPEQGTILNIV